MLCSKLKQQIENLENLKNEWKLSEQQEHLLSQLKLQYEKNCLDNEKNNIIENNETTDLDENEDESYYDYENEKWDEKTNNKWFLEVLREFFWLNWEDESDTKQELDDNTGNYDNDIDDYGGWDSDD